MKRPNLSKWQDYQNLTGLLFFAQAVEEMIFHHTIDSYKATALNIHTLSLDLRSLAADFAAERIKAGTLFHVIEELSERAKDDPVLRNAIPQVSKTYLERLQDEKGNQRGLISLANALAVELGALYWDGIKTNIRLAISDPQRKGELLLLANSLITEAEFQGYSRRYIHVVTQDFFFNERHTPHRIESLEQINDFLNLFGQKSTGWKVIFRGTSSFRNLTTHAGNFRVQLHETRPTDIPFVPRARRLLRESYEYPFYIVVDDMLAKEPYSARQHAEHHIEVLTDVYSFHAHRETLDWGKLCLAINKETNEGWVLPPPLNPTKINVQRTSALAESDLLKTIEILLRGAHFVESSRRKFFNALDYHRAALNATTAEHQLLSLWAVLEGFLPIPTKDDARITHYVDKLLPSLTLTYPEKIFRYIANSLFYGGNSVRELIERVPVDGDFFTKCVGLLASSDLTDERRNLYASLEHHPLLKYRCYICHEQFSSNKKIATTLTTHRKKVGWHIQRIYATRNLIIHSAETARYLPTLVENLHSYVDILLNTTFKIGAKSKHRISIATTLEIQDIHARSYMSELEGTELQTTSDNFKALIFGSSNPVSPYYRE